MNVFNKKVLLGIFLCCCYQFAGAQEIPQTTNADNKEISTRGRKALCEMAASMKQFQQKNDATWSEMDSMGLAQVNNIKAMIAELKIMQERGERLSFNYFFQRKYFNTAEKWLPVINELKIELEQYLWALNMSKISFTADSIKYKPMPCSGLDWMPPGTIGGSDFIKQLYEVQTEFYILEREVTKEMICASVRKSDSLHVAYTNQLLKQVNTQNNSILQRLQQTYQYQVFMNLRRKYYQFIQAGYELGKGCD